MQDLALRQQNFFFYTFPVHSRKMIKCYLIYDSFCCFCVICFSVFLWTDILSLDLDLDLLKNNLDYIVYYCIGISCSLIGSIPFCIYSMKHLYKEKYQKFYVYVHLSYHFLFALKITGILLLAYFHDGLLSSIETNLGFDETSLNQFYKFLPLILQFFPILLFSSIYQCVTCHKILHAFQYLAKCHQLYGQDIIAGEKEMFNWVQDEVKTKNYREQNGKQIAFR